MINRREKRAVINRKNLDMDCPCDQEVMKILHAHGIVANRTDDPTIGSVVSFDTIKRIRRDVFASMPNILDAVDGVVDAEVVD